MKQKILDIIDDLVGSFVYYDRKQDSTISMDQLNDVVESGEITIDDMVNQFRKGLKQTFNNC